MNNVTNMPNAELLTLMKQSRQMLTSLADSLTSRPDMQEAIRRMLSPDDPLESFNELEVKDPDLMRLTLRACAAALANVQTLKVVDREMKRRSVNGN